MLQKDEEVVDRWSSVGRLSKIHGFEAEWYSCSTSVPSSFSSQNSQLVFRKRWGESKMEERLEMFGRR